MRPFLLSSAESNSELSESRLNTLRCTCFMDVAFMHCQFSLKLASGYRLRHGDEIVTLYTHSSVLIPVWTSGRPAGVSTLRRPQALVTTHKWAATAASVFPALRGCMISARMWLTIVTWRARTHRQDAVADATSLRESIGVVITDQWYDRKPICSHEITISFLKRRIISKCLLLVLIKLHTHK
jgi:hypothetical protein